MKVKVFCYAFSMLLFIKSSKNVPKHEEKPFSTCVQPRPKPNIWKPGLSLFVYCQWRQLNAPSGISYLNFFLKIQTNTILVTKSLWDKTWKKYDLIGQCSLPHRIKSKFSEISLNRSVSSPGVKKKFQKRLILHFEVMVQPHNT